MSETAKLVAAASADLGEAPTDEQINDFLMQTFVPATRDEVQRIRALGLPTADCEQAQRRAVRHGGVLDDIVADPTAVLDQGTTRVRRHQPAPRRVRADGVRVGH